MKRKTTAKGHRVKHAGSRKHHAKTSKHHPALPAGHGGVAGAPGAAHVKAKHPHHARGLAVGDLLPVCSLEAVAMSLRLAGQPVADDEVAWLWELSGSRELSIGEALEAAVRFGLGGSQLIALRADLGVGVNPPDPIDQVPPQFGHRLHAHALILGVDLPGPHAVLATPDGWWSWGQLWTPWTTAVSEAWVISWR